MKVVFKALNFLLLLLQHITSSTVTRAEELYNYQVDQDTNYDEMDQTGNVGLDPCRHYLLFMK